MIEKSGEIRLGFHDIIMVVVGESFAALPCWMSHVMFGWREFK
jgi:hypothetical protein